ncbi:Fanconi anemia group A protein [Lates japonicus]|uniref:Fanconi anemia group A protein n=1 Tax=Lates japonicus TaxID=270547 RepID=A0AAD3N7E8_LATJO|nr:Fanconi anemia group A protein [Lates japonicus]
MSFGGGSGYHATSKKSLVFLLKFLSDLVPFEPPQYLKVHILHPPYIPVKHRSLLMEYISLAKTRLADLKPQCQAAQDVEKAVSLFESTGRISATVMEARPYFLTRFLPALLTPRVLPVKADAQMSFIEALKKADKIPAAQYSSYEESCQRQRQQDRRSVCLDTGDDPLEVLKVQLQEFTQLAVDGNDGDMLAQLSRISHTLSVIFPDRPDELIGQTVIKVHIDAPLSPELHLKVINMILRSFCQCMLDASRANPPNKQSPWASRFVTVLLGNIQLLSSLIHRLWDLFHNQGSSLSAAHVLGLAAFVVHLNASMCESPLIQLVPPILPKPVPVGEALSSALVCSTHTNMLFSVRLCVAAVCYGICRRDSLPQPEQQNYILSGLYKKLLYLIPRLLPEARRTPLTADGAVEKNLPELRSSATDTNSTWRKTAWCLWRHDAFHQLQHTPQYQLSFSEWLATDLRVQRGEDALSDPERVLLALPAVLFVKVKTEGGRMTLDCNKLIEHVNQHQRKVCSPAGLMSCHVTAHFLRGVLYASVRCRCPREEVNKAWSQISLHCPLLLTSTVHWWERLFPVLVSLWSRLCGGEPLSEQMQLLSDCQHWAHSPSSLPLPPAPALLLASSLHCACRSRGGGSQGHSAALNVLQPERGTQYRQVLVFLLFLSVNDYLSALLYPQERNNQKAWSLCSELLSVVVDSADWLLIFKSNEQSVYQSVTMVTSDEFTRLMPWAFYSLLLQQSPDLLQRAVRCPGFLHTAVLCYISLLQLFLEGHTPTPTAEPSEKQLEPSQILSDTKQFLLRVISQTSPTALSSSQRRQLESQCADLDPEVAAALSVHLGPQSLSPEMDFL